MTQRSRRTYMRKRKEYSELKFIDDFMFCKIMVTKPELCKEMLELILGLKIRKIEFSESQKSYKARYDGKGIRLDVYVEDDKDSIYDLEMQTSRKIEIPKRMRYYQGMIDVNFMSEGRRYTDLKKTYVIFICLSDIFNKNLPVYTFENICKQDNAVLLHDEAYKVVVNAAGNREGLSDEMSDFLDFLQDKKNDGKLARELDKAVNEAIQKELWKEEYSMYTMEMKIQDELWDAEINAIIKAGTAFNQSEASICQLLMSEFNIKESEAKSLIEEYNKNLEE